MHLTQGSIRVAEVLECRTADDKIERILWKGHCRCIAEPKIHADARPRGGITRDADERSADVEAGDPIGSELGKLDGEIAGSRCDLQDVRVRGKLRGDALGGRLEIGGELCGV